MVGRHDDDSVARQVLGQEVGLEAYAVVAVREDHQRERPLRRDGRLVECHFGHDSREEQIVDGGRPVGVARVHRVPGVDLEGAAIAVRVHYLEGRPPHRPGAKRVGLADGAVSGERGSGEGKQKDGQQTGGGVRQ